MSHSRASATESRIAWLGVDDAQIFSNRLIQLPLTEQFLGAAQLNMAALGSLSQDYLQGDAKADDVILQADSAVTSLLNTNPSDPSLSKTRTILRAMFLNYGRAIRADKHHHDPGKYIYQAYGLANFAHDVLSQAEPALAKRGWTENEGAVIEYEIVANKGKESAENIKVK